MSEGILRRPMAGRLDVGSMRVPERSLELLRDLVQAQTGMSYDETRLSFLRERIAPLVVNRGFDSLLDYFYLLKYDQSAGEEWSRVIDTLAVQETYFWREFDQIRGLANVIVPRVAAARDRVRIWSFPCATGEEPLSMAMALNDAGLFSRCAIEIRGSDASEAALTRARAGRYGERAFRQLPDSVRQRYFTRASPSEWTVDAELHRRITWTRVNAAQPDTWGAEGDVDVVFCRNLFIYFEAATVKRVVSAFAERMRRPSYLCIAAAESLLRLSTPFSLEDVGGAFVYVRP